MNSTHLIPAVGLGIAVLAVGCGGSSDPPARTATSAHPPARTTQVDLPAGRIAFRRYFDDAQTHGAVFTADPDGTGEKQITDPPAGHVDDHPDWSPDGKRIAFERCAEGKPCQVLTVAADGGRPHKVTAHCELNPICDLASPAWMPDGRLLVTLAQGRERPSPTTYETWIQHSSVELIDLGTGTQRTIVERSDWTLHGWDLARVVSAQLERDLAQEALPPRGARPRGDELRGRDALTLASDGPPRSPLLDTPTERSRNCRSAVCDRQLSHERTLLRPRCLLKLHGERRRQQLRRLRPLAAGDLGCVRAVAHAAGRRRRPGKSARGGTRCGFGGFRA